MDTLLKPLLIREKLLEKGIRTFTPYDFERIFKISASRTKYFLENQTEAGLFMRLKRGMYVLKTDLPCEEEIANNLYRPSYISFEYALAYHCLIPEMTYMVTSATTKPTRQFAVNHLSFAYYTIKENAYTGYTMLRTDRSVSGKGNNINFTKLVVSDKDTDAFLMAEPEKALVDFLYFVSLGKRQLNDRINGTDTLNKEKLRKYAGLYNRKKLMEIVREFL
jgi:hypothetical protein